MKPRITFVAGSDVLSTNNREFSELPPINQEIDFRDERYKVVGYQDATVVLELIPEVEEEEDAPQRSRKTTKAKAKRVAKSQAKAQAKAKRAEKSKPVAAKSSSTSSSSNAYNRR